MQIINISKIKLLTVPTSRNWTFSVDDVEELIQKRKEARDNKRWNDADAVRDQLIEAGISIADADGKTSWWRD